VKQAGNPLWQEPPAVKLSKGLSEHKTKTATPSVIGGGSMIFSGGAKRRAGSDEGKAGSRAGGASHIWAKEFLRARTRFLVATFAMSPKYLPLTIAWRHSIWV